MKKRTLRVLFILMFLCLIAIIGAVTFTIISQLELTGGTLNKGEKQEETGLSDIVDNAMQSMAEGDAVEEADAQAKEAADEASSETEDEDESPLTADEPADEETADDTQEEDTASSGPLKVVWLGDSLTQGSLGDDNGNVDNPQAPWRVLKELSGYDVEGFGYYGYYTHDILWKWGEDGGKKDPGTVYVFWCGSCDFRESQNETATVIKEIDTFLKNGKLDKYIVMGTTPRSELGVEGAKNVNGKLEDKYGDKYLDILEYVEFGPDKLHLTEASYHKIAEVVYDKIKELYD